MYYLAYYLATFLFTIWNCQDWHASVWTSMEVSGIRWNCLEYHPTVWSTIQLSWLPCNHLVHHGNDCTTMQLTCMLSTLFCIIRSTVFFYIQIMYKTRFVIRMNLFGFWCQVLHLTTTSGEIILKTIEQVVLTIQVERTQSPRRKSCKRLQLSEYLHFHQVTFARIHEDSCVGAHECHYCIVWNMYLLLSAGSACWVCRKHSSLFD